MTPSAARLTVFAAALLPRLVVGYVTLGAVDAIHSFRNFVRMLNDVPVITPYLPGVELFLWIGGIAACDTALPVVFPYKVLPILCDALVASLLYDAARNAQEGFRNALLYGAAVIPIFISAIHVQWDSICLYLLLLALVLLRDARKWPAAVAAAAIVISIIVKPIALPLAPLLFPWNRRQAPWFLIGGIGAVLVYIAILVATGLLPDAETLQGIVRYARGGVQLFGLPIRPRNRLLIVAAALALTAFLYFRRRCTREDAVLLFFALTLGLSGLSVQYLCWVIPFALLGNHTRFLALYGAAAGVFLVLAYQMPVINLPNADNLGAYAMLEPFGALSPPMPPPSVLPIALFLGNLAVPLILLGFGAWRVATLLRLPGANEEVRPVSMKVMLVPAAAIVTIIIAATLWAASRPPIEPRAFTARIEQKIAAYDVVRYDGPHVGSPGAKVWIARSFVEPGAGNRILNISTLALLCVAAGSIAAGIIRRRHA